MALEDQSAVRSTGKVNWFSDSKGFGFINPDEGGEELFVHQSSIVSEGFRSLTSGESVEFSVAKGNDGKTQAVDVTGPGGAPIPKKEKESGGRRGGCFNCGEAGHIAKDCNEGSAGCYDCGDIGHIARDCNKKLGGNGGGAGKSKGCYTCGEIDHFARDCDQKLRGNVGSRRTGGGGGGGGCYNCGGVGHMARDCVSERQSGGCYNCGGTGHIARDCDRKGRSGGGGGNNKNKCFSCGKEGHFARECPVA